MSYHRILKPFLPTVFSSHSLIRSLSTCEQHFTSRCGAQCVRLCGPSNRCLCNWLLDRLITNSHEMKGSGEETSILALLLLPCHRDKQASVSKPTKALHLKDDYSPTWEWKDHCVHSLYMVWYTCPAFWNEWLSIRMLEEGLQHPMKKQKNTLHIYIMSQLPKGGTSCKLQTPAH